MFLQIFQATMFCRVTISQFTSTASIGSHYREKCFCERDDQYNFGSNIINRDEMRAEREK